MVRESSFNMTRGGDEDVEGGGGSEIFSTTKGGAPKELNRWQGGLLKFQASSFNIFIPPPPCHIK